jgi:Rrf2 family nitric oxide-sensitive transcriptional repressor
MRLTQHVDYSLRVLMFLAVSPEGFGTVKQISEAYGISRNHLMKVVHALGQKGYIDTTRGKGGGLALSDLPNRINVGRVVRDMEADLGLVECLGSSRVSGRDETAADHGRLAPPEPDFRTRSHASL